MGTHPIFESDFDCLTDRNQTKSNPLKWTDSTLSKLSMVTNTLWVVWPPLLPSAFFKAKRSLLSDARDSLSLATSTVTSSRLWSTFASVTWPSHPAVHSTVVHHQRCSSMSSVVCSHT